MKKLEKLIAILNQARDRYPVLGRRLDEAEALGRWALAVGPAIAKHSRAIKVEETVLWVEVDHPIWKSELHHRKRQILDILNQKLAEPGKSQTTVGPLTDILFLNPRR